MPEWRPTSRREGWGALVLAGGDGGVVSPTPRRETETGLAAGAGAVVASGLVGAKEPTSGSPIP